MKRSGPNHSLPPLPYAYDALEPHLDARTLQVHHQRHHAVYVAGLNQALAEAPASLHPRTPEWLLINLSKVPDRLRPLVRRNAGGHLNHSLYWESMSPEGGGTPSGLLADAIDVSMGGFDAFKSRFEQAGVSLFGGGWVWLVQPRSGDDKLQILTTSGHENPVTVGSTPLLVADLWEHAYYLKHEDRRGDYLRAFWDVVDWKRVAYRFDRARAAAGLPAQAGGQWNTRRMP
jgi:Fe-Mn family superoxide dismutase